MTRRENLQSWGALLLAVALVIGLCVAPFTVPQAVASPPAPTAVANVFNTAVLANTDVFVPITPTDGRGTVAYRFTIVLSGVDSVVEIQINDGAATVEADLNNGVALVTGRAYTFVIGCHPDYSYTIQYETATTTGYLLIEEILDGVI